MNRAENLALMPSLISKEPAPFNSIGQDYNPKGGSEICDEYFSKVCIEVSGGRFGCYISHLRPQSLRCLNRRALLDQVL